MKKFIYILIASLTFTACKKSGNNDNGGNTSDVVLDASTGWKRVQVIPYPNAAASNGRDYMLGYDITGIGSREFGILYSASAMSAASEPIEQIYKLKFQDNDANVGSGTALKIFASAKRATFHSQLLPGTLIPVFTNYAGTDLIELYDENDSRYSALNVEGAEYLTYRYTNEGDFIMTGIDPTLYSHFWTTRYPQVVFRMTDTKKLFRNGTLTRVMSMPMKASDGVFYEFSIVKTATDVRFAALRLYPERDYNATPANFDIYGSGVLAGLVPTEIKDPNSSLVAYDFTGETFTFVLANYDASSNAIIKGLHCYRWNRNSNSLTTLWETTSVSANLSKAITSPNTRQAKINELRLTPDGTFYTIFTKEKYAEPNVNSQYTALYTVNATGTKELGRTGEELRDQSFALTTARYINGAYYALLYPQGTANVKVGNPKFHMELVKLTP